MKQITEKQIVEWKAELNVQKQKKIQAEQASSCLKISHSIIYFQVDLNSKMRSEEKRINDLWDKNRIEMAKKGTLLERAEKRER